MTMPNMPPAAGPGAAPPPRRPVDVLGIVGVIIGIAGILPALVVFLVGLIPEMNAIWWLGIVLIPILGMAGVIALILGVIGVIVEVRRRGRFGLSIAAIVLGVIGALPFASLWFGSAI